MKQPPTSASTFLGLKSKLFRGLSDRSRLAVLECLIHQPRCVSEIVAMTSLSQPNVSNHLACLRECGLVMREQQGRFAFYRLADPAVKDFLQSAEGLLELVSEKVEACPNYEDPSDDD